MWPGAKDLLENNPHVNRVHPEKPDSNAASWRRCDFSGRCGASATSFPSTRIRKAAIHYRLAARIVGAPVRISHEYECFGWLDRWLVNRHAAAGLRAACH